MSETPVVPSRVTLGPRRLLATLPVAVVLLAAGPGWGAPPSALPPGFASLAGATGDKPLAEPQLDTPTFRLARDYAKFPSGALRRAALDQLTVEGELVLVSIDMLDEPAAVAMAEALPGLGAQVTARHRRWIEAKVPVSRLKEVARRPGVSLVHRPAPLLPLRPGQEEPSVALSTYSTGAYQTQGVVRSAAHLWHQSGLQGGGRKVGIMDSFQYYTNAQAAGELPPTLATLGSVGLDSDHGTNVAEIIYDMAPAAGLTITTPAGGCAAQAASIVSFAQAGHDIISSSIGSLQCGAGDGNPATDPIASAANDALNTYGTLFFQAAGNHANKHWDGTYNGGGNGTYHQFATGADVNQLGYVPAGTPIVLFLRWNAWPTTNQDYDLFLVYSDGASGWQLVTSSEGAQTGSQPPEEAIGVAAPLTGYYAFVISKYAATSNHVLTSLNFYLDLQYKVQDRSLVGPATNPYTVAVAAVDVNSLALESYSSWGPTYGAGGAVGGGWGQPLLSGFANVSTWVGAATGSPPFNGTSSATPHVSGAAAVAWGANPCLTPLQLLGFLEGRSTDAGTAGYDVKYGYGVLNLKQPVNDGCQMEKADFNGDGYADILWRSRAGALYLWFMAGNGLVGSTAIPPISTAWQVQGVGDFNGDGKSDILWRDVGTGSAATYLWLMNGGTVAGTGYASQQPDGNWRIQGIGDFNGDGKSDILWRHSGGALYLWFMNGTTVDSVLAVPEISNIWQIVRVGDFNGDGRADMLWRDTNSGATYMWLMNGSTVIGTGYTSSLTDNAWQIQGVGDFNKDGRADILWRQNVGALYVWFMNGTSVIGSSFLASIDNSWQVEGVADLNGEGHADILWRHPASSATYVWLMDGATVAAAGYTTAQADSNWFARPVYRHR